MSTRTTPWPNGTPAWADVPMPDRAVGEAFYAAVLGWRFASPQDLGGYADAYLGDRPVAGSMHLSPGRPVAWTVYFAVDDAERTAEAITAHGGTVLASTAPSGTVFAGTELASTAHVGPMDATGRGAMVIATDPSGAGFGLWQAGSHIGTGVYGEPGAIAWEDLRSTDPAAAQAFYGAVFGIEVRPLEPPASDQALASDDGSDTAFGSGYGTMHLPGQEGPVGGLGGMMGMSGPSHWQVYFAVADVAAAVIAATGHGGAVVRAISESPFGPIAKVADPAGAEFWVVTPAMPSPDRP